MSKANTEYLTPTAASTDADVIALQLHTEAIELPHRAAFRGPVVTEYAVGAVVWMYDHYNTAVVTGPGRKAGMWCIKTQDADDSESKYEYQSDKLRPAAEPMVFTWTTWRK